MDSLDVTDKHYDRKYQDMEERLYKLYDDIDSVEEEIEEELAETVIKETPLQETIIEETIAEEPITEELSAQPEKKEEQE